LDLGKKALASEKSTHQRFIDRASHLERVQKALQHETRVVADGLAWRAMDYDRTAITVLAGGQQVGHLALGPGFDEEVKRLEELWNQHQSLVLHNDCTYCLRHGDLTLILEDGIRRIPIPVEVKASKRLSPASSQVRRIEEAKRRLAQGRVTTPVEYKTFLPLLSDRLDEARRTGFAEWKPAPALFVCIADFRHFGYRPEELGKRREEAEAKLGWFGSGDTVLRGTTTYARIRDRAGAISTLAPLSIFPLPVRDVVELMLGFLDVSVYLNVQLLRDVFLKHGIWVDVPSQPEASDTFFKAQDGRGGVLVPAFVREQMLLELMTPGTLLALVDHVLASGLASRLRTDSKVVGFYHERDVWSPNSRLQVKASNAD
jgi:hypothetical protein